MGSKHEFAGVTGTNTIPRVYTGKCKCGYATQPDHNKDEVYEKLANHMLSTPEFEALLESAPVGPPMERIPAGKDHKRPHRPRPSLDHRDQPEIEVSAEMVQGIQHERAHWSCQFHRDAKADFLTAEWIIGSHPSCNWQIENDPTVAPRHAKIQRCVHGYFTVEALVPYGVSIHRKAPHGIHTMAVTHPMQIMPGDQVWVMANQLGDPPEPELKLGDDTPVS